MLKKTLTITALLFSMNVMAESAPDCSQDQDGRILNGIVVSFIGTKYHPLVKQMLGKDVHRTIRLLSSNEISTKEKKRLMERRAKKNGYSPKDIEDSGITMQYMQNRIFRQYYEFEVPNGPHLIAEYYSIPDYCGVDLESIYFISDKTEGFTPDFADR